MGNRDCRCMAMDPAHHSNYFGGHEARSKRSMEASMVDGAGEWRNFFQITLPNLYPFLLIAILLRFMDNFRFIDALLVLTGGGPANSTKILPTYLFDVSFQFFKLGVGLQLLLRF